MLWFRRDLRVGDHPALGAAAADGPVTPLFVIDPALWRPGTRRTDRLAASLKALDDSIGGNLVVRTGTPESVVPAVAAEIDAKAVHVSAETTPYGRRRDARVREALGDVRWVETGSPYAVTPGRVVKSDDTPYRVFTPFSRAWKEHGWRAPAQTPDVQWHSDLSSDRLPDTPGDVEAGESAAMRRWHDFLEGDTITRYDRDRDRPDLHGTSRLSIALKYGEIHPRTLLADLAPRRGRGVERFVAEICWREFYGDVLWHNPRALHHDLRDDLKLTYDDPGPEFEAWKSGNTGFPFVDAGMRQLQDEGWMHNRVRMVTASFLTKHLHVWWLHGAAHFSQLLLDGDPASNSQGWQWVAGTGTDAAPYFRIFNPITQGLKFDPHGDYVRRYVPELRHLEGAAAHEPWKHEGGYDAGYPKQLVEHAEARREALARYEEARA